MSGVGCTRCKRIRRCLSLNIPLGEFADENGHLRCPSCDFDFGRIGGWGL